MKKDNNHKNMALIAASAVILVAVNLGVWMAARNGSIAPVGNSVMWGGFMALNVASILWAVTLLGLQPMVVSLSYVAGGFLAFKGVQGMGGISVAEVTTAGATYGAFGALAVGNATTKVRFAFYNRKQVPFIFIIAALLVLDAVINSGISSAGGSVILNAVVFPFVLAGVIVGLVWSVLNRYGIGYNPRTAAAGAETVSNSKAKAQADAEDGNALMIQVPDHAEAELEEEQPAAVAEKIIEPEVPPTPAVKKSVAPAASRETRNEEFFPLEIDKDDGFVLPQEEDDFSAVMNEGNLDSGDTSFSMEGFDSSLYESGAMNDSPVGVMVEEPVTSVALDLDETSAPVAKREKAPVADKKPAGPEKEAKSEDWLSGHLDLLNKLK